MLDIILQYPIIGYATLGMLLLILLVYLFAPKQRTQRVSDMNRKDFHKALNFMQQHGVIDSQEYMEILTKSQPFLK